MAVFRFLSGLFLLIAVVALVADLTPAISGEGALTATTIAAHWRGLAPTTLEAAQAFVTSSAGGWLWDLISAVLLDRPTFLVFGVLGVLAGFLGRRRSRVNVFVN